MVVTPVPLILIRVSRSDYQTEWCCYRYCWCSADRGVSFLLSTLRGTQKWPVAGFRHSAQWQGASAIQGTAISSVLSHYKDR